MGENYPLLDFNGCPLIIKAKIVPDEMLTIIDDGRISAINGPFGGVEISESGSSYKKFFIKYYLQGNEEACVELSTHDWTNADVESISVGRSGQVSSFSEFPVSVDRAVEACSPNPWGIIFNFK